MKAILIVKSFMENYDAIATLKNGKLLFMPVGMGMTVGSESLADH